MLELRGLSKRHEYAERSAVEALDLTVEEGLRVVMVGPSGAGKSTLLRLIAGLEKATAGTIHFAGHDMTSRPPRSRGVGFVFQNPPLLPHLLVHEQLLFGLRRDARRKVSGDLAGLVETLSLGPFLRRRPESLSAGERQRVALARAVIRQPRLLLLDEPFVNLDPSNRQTALECLCEIHRRFGMTMILVTHDQAEALAFGERVGVMKDGRIIQFDTPEAVHQSPNSRFVAEFIGQPPMNLLLGRVEGHTELMFMFLPDARTGLRLPDPPPSRVGPLLLGIRPEGLELHPTESTAKPGELPGLVTSQRFQGHEKWFTVRIVPSGPALTVRSPVSSRLQPGNQVAVRWCGREPHWFDVEHGQRLLVEP